MLVDFEGVDYYEHYISFLELYLNRFFDPIYNVDRLSYNDLTISLIGHEQHSFWNDGCPHLIDQGFNNFVSLIKNQVKYFSWNRDELSQWLK